jgi:hypothetical protein
MIIKNRVLNHKRGKGNSNPSKHNAGNMIIKNRVLNHKRNKRNSIKKSEQKQLQEYDYQEQSTKS